MKIKILHEDAILPQKAHKGDLGYDLFSNVGKQIYPGEVTLISTGLAIQFPYEYGALIRDRSSISTKKRLFVVAGVIDNGYIGEIQVALFNATPHMHFIPKGEKIAQLILIPVVNSEIEVVDELVPPDERGTGGFGSTNRQLLFDSSGLL